MTGSVRNIVERQTRLGVEILGLNGVNVDGRGANVGVLMPRPIRGIPPEILARLSSHLAAAYRLRARLGSGSNPDRAEALFAASGKLEHAVGQATLPEAREALAQAAARIGEIKRARRRADPERALRLWKALVDARWSLVDHFERDGTRYLLAQRNDPEVAPIALGQGIGVLGPARRGAGKHHEREKSRQQDAHDHTFLARRSASE